ncbi:MAG: aminotransferase class III-fold pyridoxal phosphate-dependent enzyme [Ideonella sp.]|nr:aminotransferase class III-fold pyridoxal phosphate-dependent enzyme [Ideonella sp.]
MSQATDQLSQRDVASILHPYTQMAQHRETGPLVMARGDGVYVEDSQGRRYLEGMAGLWCTSLGFSEQRLVDAATRQMQALPYYQLFNGRATEPAIELAERLLALTADLGMDKVLFANSGSEANDQAVKLVWYHFNALGLPNKKKLIARVRGYHGVTVMAGSLTGLAANHADFDLPVDRVLRTDCPSHHHHGLPGESESAFVDRIIGHLEALIEREGADTIAAFFAEPVQGAGGVIVPPAGYFERLQAVLRRHGILLVVDEMITGFGRTGQMFGSQTFGIQPDLMTVAKAMSSAYLPISATLMSKAVYDTVCSGSAKHGSFAHGVTYAGHPACAAVANETLKIYAERDLVGQVRALAPQMQARLQALRSHPLVTHARGVGLIGALEIARDLAPRVQAVAAEQGLIVRALRDAVAVCPPLIITPAQIDELFDKLGRALDLVQREASAAGRS